MKRLLVLFIIVLMVLAFVACKNEVKDEGGESGDALPVSKAEGEEKLIEQGSSAKAIDHTGFSFVITTGDGDKLAIGGKDGIFWTGYSQDEEPMEYIFCKDINDVGYMYVNEPPVTGWVSVKQSFSTYLFGAIESMLFSAHEAESNLAKGNDETIFGRSCVTYGASVSIEDVSSSVKFWVDKEYGVTLKIEYESTTIDDSFQLDIVPSFSNPELPTGYAEAKACETTINIPE